MRNYKKIIACVMALSMLALVPSQYVFASGNIVDIDVPLPAESTESIVENNEEPSPEATEEEEAPPVVPQDSAIEPEAGQDSAEVTDVSPAEDTEGEDVEGEDTDPWQAVRESFAQLIADHDVYAVLYNISNGEYFDLRVAPSDSAAVAHKLLSGSQVILRGLEIVDGQVWYQIEFVVNEAAYSAYVKNENITSADASFQEWKTTYNIDEIGRLPARTRATNLSAFPESYRPYIQALMNAHPNWTFVPFNTGLRWEDVISNEMSPRRNLVPLSSPSSWKANDNQVEPGWVQASESIVRTYMDPRNFLNATSVFQFELLTFNASTHTEAGVEAILSGTFMSRKPLEDGSAGGRTYASVFMEMGRAFNVSPYFLASRVKQEQGTAGNSKLISGNYQSPIDGVNYSGYYNYFNIEASGPTTDHIVTAGLKEAKNSGWNSRYAALKGGAEKTANRYIQRGQNTLYFQKFDVDSSYDGLYWHQYMQNLLAADNEGKSTRAAYEKVGALGNSFVFRVPVYDMYYNGVNYSTVFDFDFYLKKYADINKAYAGNPNGALEHFINYGIAEGRQASPVFDVTYYASKYADVRSAFGNNRQAMMRHFIDNGMKEGRQGSAEFNIWAYRYQYRDVRQAFSLNNLPAYYLHYVTNGRKEGRKATNLGNLAKLTMVNMYRIYNPNNGEHFYTSNTVERSNLLRLGWKDEGIAWRSPVNAGDPVYRLYNPNTGEHHYTLNANERDSLAKRGWRYEQIAWRSYKDATGSDPMYRVYNPNAKGTQEAGAHHHTGSLGERNSLLRLGWRDEGVGFYGL